MVGQQIFPLLNQRAAKLVGVGVVSEACNRANLLAAGSLRRPETGSWTTPKLYARGWGGFRFVPFRKNVFSPRSCVRCGEKHCVAGSEGAAPKRFAA